MDKLRFACETWGAEGFALVQANPDAKDMFDLCFAPVKSSYIEFEKLLSDLLRAPLAESGLGLDATEVARIILFSIKGFKETARDVKDMRRLIATHTTLIAHSIESHEPKREKKYVEPGRSHLNIAPKHSRPSPKRR